MGGAVDRSWATVHHQRNSGSLSFLYHAMHSIQHIMDNRPPLLLRVPTERWKRWGVITLIYDVIAKQGFQGNLVLQNKSLVFDEKSKTFILTKHYSAKHLSPKQAADCDRCPILKAGHTLSDIPQPCSLLPAYSAHLLTRMVAEYPINLTVWQSGLYATVHDHSTVF